MTWVVGLTGGIGSGKSAAAEHFRTCGAVIIDTDVIAHELTTAGGTAIALLRETFGTAILTPEGALDRAAMRRRVFADPQERTRLEAILHPLIRAESEARLRRLAGTDFCYAVLVVPLLAETGRYRERVNRICVVDCTEETQIARVQARNGLDRETVLAIMAAQAGRAERRSIADDIIDNDGDLDALHAQVDRLHAHYRQLATV